MSEQNSRESFLVRGENVDLWLPVTLAVLGLCGALITAQLLFSHWSAYFAQLSEPMATEEVQARGNPAFIESGTGGVPGIAEQTEAAQAAPAPEADLSVAAVTSKITEEIATPTSSSEPPGSDAVGREMAPSNGSTSGALDDQAADEQSVEETSISSQQVELTEEREAPEAGMSPLAEARDASTNAMASEPEAVHETGPADAKGPTAPGGIEAVAALSIGDAMGAEQANKGSSSDCAPLFSVDFNHGSTKPEVRGIEGRLAPLALWLNAHPGAVLYLDGHADSSGPADANLVISFRRAVAVSSLLADAGAPKARLVPRAYGEGASSSPSTESEMQRRVTLEINSGVPCDQPVSKDGDPR